MGWLLRAAITDVRIRLRDYCLGNVGFLVSYRVEQRAESISIRNLKMNWTVGYCVPISILLNSFSFINCY